MKFKYLTNKFSFISALIVFWLCAFSVEITAQIRQVTAPAPEAQDDYTWWYIMLFVLIVGLGGAIAWLVKTKKAEKKALESSKKSQKTDYWETESVDLNEQMEWLRQNNAVKGNKQKKRKPKKASQTDFFERNEFENDAESESQEPKIETPLPVFGFAELLPSKSFTPLSISSNESLMNAIEQAQDEDEEDEEVRDLAVRVLAAFKFRNSIEALSQVALYDLSSGLRSKAVSVLVEFDHESVFEGILLAGADPTREVRAAAARGLSRLSFDRADAWTRIAETNEEGRMRQTARAAIEGGFVERSFERLAHHDQKYAYEAFVLLALLIKSGEVEPIFEALKNHPDENVKLALLHLITVTKSHNTLDGLYALLEDKNLSPEVKEKISTAIETTGLVMA